MNVHAYTPASLTDLYTVPDDTRRYELVHGHLVSEPPPGGRHGRIAARLVHRLASHVEEHAPGVVLTCDTAFILHRDPDTVRAPDIAFVTSERYAAFGDDSAALPGPPDLAVEVTSPSDTPAKVHTKVADYLAAGTKLVWVVDPMRRTITTYRELLSPRVLAGADVLQGEPVLPDFRLTVAHLFDTALRRSRTRR